MGLQLHKDIASTTKSLPVEIQTALLSMYSKCGTLENAVSFFQEITQIGKVDIACWNLMMKIYVQKNAPKDALQLFNTMQKQAIVDLASFHIAIQACTSLKDLEQCREIHKSIKSVELDMKLQTAMLEMYSSSGSLADCEAIFTQLDNRLDVAAYTAMISVYVNHRKFTDAIMLYHKMKQKGISPNAATFACALSACAKLKDFTYGQQVLEDILAANIPFNLQIQTSLLNLYAKCGKLDEASEIFGELQFTDSLDPIAYGAMISALRHVQSLIIYLISKERKE